MQFAMGFQVGMARQKFKIKAPATTGNKEFERIFRAHQNVLEYMPMFLILLWIAGSTGGNCYLISILAVVWIIARIMYFKAYSEGAKLRRKSFMTHVTCLLLLLLTIIYNLI